MPKQLIKAKEVGVEELCSLMEQSSIEETLDLGSTILHVADHVHHGRLVLISTACGRAAVLSL